MRAALWCLLAAACLPAAAGPETERAGGTVPAGSISLSEMADLATDKVIGRVSSGTGAPEAVTFTDQAQTLAACTTDACERAALGFGDAAVSDQWMVLTQDTSNSTLVEALATGSTFTPAANDVYLVSVYGGFTAAANTTGLTWRIDCNTGTSGPAFLQTRGAAFNTLGAYYGVAGTSAAGTSSNGITPFSGWTICTAAATPTAIGIYFATEVDTSQVTVKAGSVIVYRKIVDN